MPEADARQGRRPPRARHPHATRLIGQRARPRQSRCHTGPPWVARARHHGVVRGSSCASSRWRTITERMSWSVAANRSSPTRRARSRSCSSEVCPTRARPTPASSERQHDPDDRQRRPRERAGARPARSARWVRWRVRSATSTAAQTTSTAPMRLASRARRRTPDATNADPHTASDASTPNAAPASIHSTRSPPSGLDAMLPATAPPTAGTSTTPRSCCTASGRSTSVRGMGASRRNETSADSGASGPPCAPDRSPSSTSTATASPSRAAPCCCTSWRAAASKSAPERDAAVEEPDRGEDADDVRLVERVDPVAFAQVVAPTRPGGARGACSACCAASPDWRTTSGAYRCRVARSRRRRSGAPDHAPGSTPPPRSSVATTSSASRGL